MTKGKNKALKRRALRKRDKLSSFATGKMLGAYARMGYGDGRYHPEEKE